MTDPTTAAEAKANLDWEPKRVTEIRLGDQILCAGSWRSVTGRREGITDVALWYGEHRPICFPPTARVMVRTIEIQAARRKAAKDAVDQAVGKVRAAASGWVAALTGKAGAR